MKRIYRLFCVLVTLLPAPVLAVEDIEIQRLKDSIARIQEDMNMMQREFYQKSPTGGGASAKGKPAIGAEFIDIEEKMRQLNGKVEELTYQVETLQKKNDDLTNQFYENLARINSILEQNNLTAASTGVVPVTPAPTAAAVPAPVITPAPPSATAPTTAALPARAPEGNPLAPNTDIIFEKGPSGIVQPEEAPYDAKLPKTPESNLAPAAQYEQAFQLLRQSKYIEAQAALETFIKQHPKNPLVENSYYWLGETFYKRNEYNQAAVNFMKGYQSFPKGNKSVDNLYKLALSLEKLNKKKEACTTLKKLSSEFPTMAPENKNRVDAQKKQLSCS